MIQQSHSWACIWIKPITQKDKRTPVSTAALVTTARTWKQPKCPSTEEWIKMWYIYYSATNKEWNNALCSDMDGPRDCHTEWNKSKTKIIWRCLYVKFKKKWYKWTYKTEIVTGIENKFMVTSSVQLHSRVWLLCSPMNCSMPGLPVHHQLPESTQTHVHWVSDAIRPSSGSELKPLNLVIILCMHAC